MISFDRPHHDWPVGRLSRWGRRLVTIPITIVLATAVWALSPLLLVAALIADLAEGWKRRRWRRVLRLVLGYLALEIAMLIMALALWLATGFGLLLARGWSRRAHQWVKVFWAASVLRLVTKCMASRLHIEGAEVVPPGPIITLARHVSMGDAVIPAIVLGKLHRFEMRFLLKDDLVLVPAIDIFAHRLPNFFVDRTPHTTGAELEPIRRLAEGIGERSSGVVFPEGTFRTPERFERAIERIAAGDPDRAARVGRLRHLLPPRPGGTLAMLQGSPKADVVIIAHTGFEAFHSLSEILANIPADDEIEVQVWRIPRAEIPADEAGRIRWLDEQWQHMDDWIDERAAHHAHG